MASLWGARKATHPESTVHELASIPEEDDEQPRRSQRAVDKQPAARAMSDGGEVGGSGDTGRSAALPATSPAGDIGAHGRYYHAARWQAVYLSLAEHAQAIYQATPMP